MITSIATCKGQLLAIARTAYVENYQPGMAATLAAAIVKPEEPHDWDAAHAVSSSKAAGHLVKLPWTGI